MFDTKCTEIKELVDARKTPFTEEKAWGLLKDAKEIIVGRGKKYLSFTPSDAAKQEILGNCLGRTGNLRAPALKIGTMIIVGFNDDMYAKYLGR